LPVESKSTTIRAANNGMETQLPVDSTKGTLQGRPFPEVCSDLNLMIAVRGI